MQTFVLSIAALVIGLGMVVHRSVPRQRILGALIVLGAAVQMLRAHPARAQLVQEQEHVENLCFSAALSVELWAKPASAMGYDFSNRTDLLNLVAFQGAQALVLDDTLAPILRRCVATWSSDCENWLDDLSIPEYDAKPGEVPPMRARTAAALQEALRTHACPKYTPMQGQGT